MNKRQSLLRTQRKVNKKIRIPALLTCMGALAFSCLFAGCGEADPETSAEVMRAVVSSQEQVAPSSTAEEQTQQKESAGTESNQAPVRQQGILPQEAKLRADLEDVFMALQEVSQGNVSEETVALIQALREKQMELKAAGIEENYQKVAGVYCIAEYDDYPQSILEQFYGEGFADRLFGIMLGEDGNGKVLDRGSSLDFSFCFDDNYICVFSEQGGSLLLRYESGELVLTGRDEKAFVFAKREGR